MTKEKVGSQMRIDPDADRKTKAAIPRTNFQSQNELGKRYRNMTMEILNEADCLQKLWRASADALGARGGSGAWYQPGWYI